MTRKIFLLKIFRGGKSKNNKGKGGKGKKGGKKETYDLIVNIDLAEWQLTDEQVSRFFRNDDIFVAGKNFLKIMNYQSWALPVIFHFFTNKKLFFCTFYKVNNLFLHQSYLKSPLPVKLI